MNKSHFGIIGLGVMGRSLAKNIAGEGFSLSVYNRNIGAEKDVVSNFLKETDDLTIQGHTQLNDFVGSLAQPRKILLMISAGAAVDAVIEQLTPLLSKGDIVMDGGNSHFQDTQRRVLKLEQNKINFLGIGISGGEQGALNGPSMMAGGSKEAYLLVKGVLEALSAKDRYDRACISLVGPDGSGHFVKTIHNGIEYAEMQLLAECYALLRPTLSNDEIATLFREWNQGELQSYLLEISANILQKKDGADYLVDKIVDIAHGKGTGVWSSQAAFNLGVPATMINAAVTARFVSVLKEQRTKLAAGFSSEKNTIEIPVEQLKSAYSFARLINHHQGFAIIKAASEENNWNIDLSEVARIWTQGCIIKSRLMEQMVDLYRLDTDLMQHVTIVSELKNKTESVKVILNNAFTYSIATPCISNSLQYWFSLSSESSPANLIQAQRDYFGAHTYKRTDKPSDENFTTNWNTHG